MDEESRYVKVILKVGVVDNLAVTGSAHNSLAAYEQSKNGRPSK